MDIRDRPAERDYFVAHRGEELDEAVGSAVCLRERSRVAERCARAVAHVPAGIGLRDQHDRR
jgi:hypothetical protein